MVKWCGGGESIKEQAHTRNQDLTLDNINWKFNFLVVVFGNEKISNNNGQIPGGLALVLIVCVCFYQSVSDRDTVFDPSREFKLNYLRNPRKFLKN